jgi:hypothetical protein
VTGIAPSRVTTSARPTREERERLREERKAEHANALEALRDQGSDAEDRQGRPGVPPHTRRLTRLHPARKPRAAHCAGAHHLMRR